MSKDEYLITDAPLKALTVFAMPMILGSFFQQVYNMADSIIVGQFVGSSALAAVGACAAFRKFHYCLYQQMSLLDLVVLRYGYSGFLYHRNKSHIHRCSLCMLDSLRMYLVGEHACGLFYQLHLPNLWHPADHKQYMGW